MDLWTFVMIVALFACEENKVLGQEFSNITTTTTTKPCVCTNPTPATTLSNSNKVTLIMGILTVSWTKCKGQVMLVPYPHFNSSSLPVCCSNMTRIEMILGNVCESRKGCKNELHWDTTTKDMAYTITDEGANRTSACGTLQIRCKVEELPDFKGQLRICKVVIVLLSLVLLVLLLIRFTRPTVMALQKRLSDRRQHRWVGPTQSQSVSYHRGKSAVRNDDEEKRCSYPALERLTVADSSPSCNRNFYNF